MVIGKSDRYSAEVSVFASTEDGQSNLAEREPLSDNKPSLKIDVVRIGPDGSAVFAGRGSPDADVMIFEKDKVLAQTSVSADGEWVAVAEQVLSPGKHLIIVKMTTKIGEVFRADQAVIVELDIIRTRYTACCPCANERTGKGELIQTPESFISATQTAQQAANTEDLGLKLNAVLVESAELSVLTLSWTGQDKLFIKGTSSGGAAVRGMLNGRVFRAAHDIDSGDWTATIRLDGLSGKDRSSCSFIC